MVGIRKLAFAVLLISSALSCVWRSTSARVFLSEEDGPLGVVGLRRVSDWGVSVTTVDGLKSTTILPNTAHLITVTWSSGNIVAIEGKALDDSNNITAEQMGKAFIDSVTGRVIVLNSHGRIMARSKISVAATSIAIDKRIKHVAFIGRPLPDAANPSPFSYGLYAFDLNASVPQKILSVSQQEDQRVNSPQSTLDWLDEETFAYSSSAGDIFVCKYPSGSFRRVASGWGARWSPTESVLAFLSRNHQVTLLNTSTNTTEVLLPGRKMLPQPPEWSPRGRYLLVAERKVRVWPCLTYGALLMYRLSDGETVELPCGYGLHPPYPVWLRIAE